MITGAASGLGAATARGLARSGADIIVNYRSDRGVLDEIVAEAAELGVRCMVVQGDVSVDSDCRALAVAASKPLNRVSGLM